MNCRRPAFAPILAALAKQPHTLTSLCRVVEELPGRVLPRLRDMARRGMAVRAVVRDRHPAYPGEVVAGHSRVVWKLPEQPMPTFEDVNVVPHSSLATPESRRRRRREKLDPYTKDRRGALEILSMLAGRTSYTVPTQGRSTKEPGVTALDVAHALAASPEKLGASVGLAIACQRESEWPTVHELAYEPLLHDLRRQQLFPRVVAGALKYRVRLVLADAFHDLIRPQCQPPYRVAAKERAIAENAYRFLHQRICTYLEAAASAAAGDACRFLFAPMAEGADEPTIMLADTEGRVTTVPAANLSTTSRLHPDVVDWLIDEMRNPNNRTRTLGTLTINGVQHVAVYVNEEPIA